VKQDVKDKDMKKEVTQDVKQDLKARCKKKDVKQDVKTKMCENQSFYLFNDSNGHFIFFFFRYIHQLAVAHLCKQEHKNENLKN
jgi:hypothetical protein